MSSDHFKFRLYLPLKGLLSLEVLAEFCFQLCCQEDAGSGSVLDSTLEIRLYVTLPASKASNYWHKILVEGVKTGANNVRHSCCLCQITMCICTYWHLLLGACSPTDVWENFTAFLFFQTSVQVPAPAAGVIEALLVPDGGKVEGGTPLFKLRKTGGKSGMYNLPLCFCQIFSEVLSI